MRQKLLITLTVISISFTAFLAGYLISQTDFHRNPNSNSTGNVLDKFSNSSPDSSTQALSSGTLRLLSQRSAISPVISKDSDAVTFYEKGTGKVFEVTLKNPTEKVLSDALLPNLIKTIWSPNKKEVVSLFYSPQGTHYKYYNSTTKTSVDLGTHIKSLSFSPSGDHVAYFETGSDYNRIFISQPDGTVSKKMLNSRLESPDLYWPSENDIAFKTNTPGGPLKEVLFGLSTNGDLTDLLEQRQGLQVKWSGDGKKILFSSSESGILNLSYKDYNGTDFEPEVSLGVSTLASKCVWSIDDKSVICGVPKSSSAGDEIYKISLDGTKKLLSSPSSNISVGEIFLSNLEDYVIILNSLDNKLYVLNK